MITVKATREGRMGIATASGYVIDGIVPFVALPSARACHERRAVRVVNPLNERSVVAIVLDVGPWNTHDDAYVYQVATGIVDAGPGEVRPAAEAGVSVSGHGTNGAGIDLGEWVWRALDMKDNGDVQWEFV